jgi:hypothetical protein
MPVTTVSAFLNENYGKIPFYAAARLATIAT